MSDITLTAISSGYNLGKINQNFEEVERVINDEVMHTSGGNNIMTQNLDINDNRILNLPEPLEATDPVRLMDIDGLVAELIGVGPTQWDYGRASETIQVYTDYGLVTSVVTETLDFGSV